jgi:hypothetical protein
MKLVIKGGMLEYRLSADGCGGASSCLSTTLSDRGAILDQGKNLYKRLNTKA